VGILFIFQNFWISSKTDDAQNLEWRDWRIVYLSFFLGRMLEVWPHFFLRQLVALGWRRA
jgi:hypothetical protein